MLKELFSLLMVLIKFIFILAGTIFDFFLELTELPTSTYGLVEFLCKNNVLIMNSKVLTEGVLIVVPLAVSFIVGKLNIKRKKDKEMFSIILYISILYILSLWQFWVALAILAVSAAILMIVRLHNRRFNE